MVKVGLTPNQPLQVTVPAIATVGAGRCFSARSLKIGQPDVTVMKGVVL